MVADKLQTKKDKFMTDKFTHDSVSQAIKLAKTHDVDARLIKKLTIQKQDLKKICANNSGDLLRLMSLSDNTIDLGNGWYGIRYQNKKLDNHLRVEALVPDGVDMIKRNALLQHDLTQTEIDTLMPALIDEVSLDLYKASVQAEGKRILEDELGVRVGSDEDEEIDVPIVNTVIVSVHAGTRWVQRIHDVPNMKTAKDMYLSDPKYKDEIIQAHMKAEKVWQDDEGIEYSLDDDNIMYVKGAQNNVPTIITLYEENFGFTKEINRMITLKQLEVLRDKHKQLSEVRDEARDALNSISGNIHRINDEVAVLEDKIKLLLAERTSLQANRDLHNRKVQALDSEYVAEFNKLFRKWDSQGGQG